MNKTIVLRVSSPFPGKLEIQAVGLEWFMRHHSGLKNTVSHQFQTPKLMADSS
jgi:hypothetical protein